RLVHRANRLALFRVSSSGSLLKLCRSVRFPLRRPQELVHTQFAQRRRWDAALAITHWHVTRLGRYVTLRAAAASGDEAVDRTVLRARKFHAPLGDEGREQIVEQPHDRRIARQLVGTVTL